MLEENMCVVFFVVIEEEDVKLHFDWACFRLLLLFRLRIGCRTRVQKGLEGS